MNKKITSIAVISTLLLSISSVGLSAGNAKQTVNKQNYSMCAAVRMKEINLNHLKKDPEKYSTLIPAGWTVVGGTGGEGHPKLLLCR